MRTDGKTNKQTATQLDISKLSVVGNPAHAQALAAIIKSASIEGDDENLFKQTFMEAMGDMVLEEQTEAFMSSIWDSIWALRRSIRNTIKDPNVSNKKEIITSNVTDFATSLGSIISSTNVIKSGGKNMKKEEVEAMVKSAVDPLNAKLAKSEAILKMDVETRVHFDALDTEGQDNFLKMSVEDQADVLKKKNEKVNKAKNDESTVIDGVTIVKSEVGAGLFQVLKNQQSKIDKGEKDLTVEKEARELAIFEKQAEGLFPNLPGEPVLKGKVLKALKGLGKEIHDALSGMLKAGDKAIETAKMFDEYGTGEISIADDSSADAQLNKMAEDYSAENKVNFHKAYTAVMETVEGKDLYEKTLKK